MGEIRVEVWERGGEVERGVLGGGVVGNSVYME